MKEIIEKAKRENMLNKPIMYNDSDNLNQLVEPQIQVKAEKVDKHRRLIKKDYQSDDEVQLSDDGAKREIEKKKRRTIYDDAIGQLLLTMIPDELPC